MFIKDVLSFLTEPFSFTMVMMATGVWFMIRAWSKTDSGKADNKIIESKPQTGSERISHHKLGVRLFSAGFILLLFFSSKPGSYLLISSLESAYEPLLQWPTFPNGSFETAMAGSSSAESVLSPPSPSLTVSSLSPAIEAIVVLGGGLSMDGNLPATSQIGPVSLQRLMEGVRIWKMAEKVLPVGAELPKLVVSGGTFVRPDEPGRWTVADVMQGVLLETGQLATGQLESSANVLASNLVLSPAPRTTEEEVEALKGLVGQGASIVLVTSASHMKRALALFKAQGFSVIPAPTYYLNTPVKAFRFHHFTWSPEYLRISHAAVHEYIGMVWSVIRGRT